MALITLSSMELVLSIASGAALAVVLAMAWRGLRGHRVAHGGPAEAHGSLAAQDSFADRLFQVGPMPMVVKDTAGRFIRVNQAWCAFTGIAPERALGHTLGALYPAQLAAPHEVQEQMAINAAQPASYEEQVLDADGLPRDVIVRVMPFAGPGGGMAGVIVCLMDVTEFREAEARTLEAKNAAELASATKTEFLANISHELRTPLQTILGFSELGMLRGRHEPKLQGMFSDVHAAGERMLALVNNLLELSRITSTIGDVALQPMDPAPLVRELAHELRELAARRQLTIRLPASQAPPWVLADATRLQQVLRNLLANALRFAPQGSAVELDWQWQVQRPRGPLRITVRDHGPGVPEAELESIFEPFVQSSRTKDGSGGTGLGLAICRTIMAAHGGSVRARNHPDGGAEFELSLPVARRQPPPGTVAAAAPATAAAAQTG